MDFTEADFKNMASAAESDPTMMRAPVPFFKDELLDLLVNA